MKLRVSYEYEITTESQTHRDRIIRELLQRPSLGSMGAGVGEGGKVYGYRVDLIAGSGRVDPDAD